MLHFWSDRNRQKNCGRGVEPRPHDYVSASPDKLRTDLANARITGVGDISEACAADIPARIHELRVVENIEEFSPNLEQLGFCDRDRLLNPEIGIVEARAVEESPVRRPETSAISAGQNPRRPRPIWVC